MSEYTSQRYFDSKTPCRLLSPRNFGEDELLPMVGITVARSPINLLSFDDDDIPERCSAPISELIISEYEIF